MKRKTIKCKPSKNVELKRLYLDCTGILSKNCEKCNQEMTIDLSEKYLTNPNFGGKDKIYFFCDECCEDCKIEIEISPIKITILDEKTTIKKVNHYER